MPAETWVCVEVDANKETGRNREPPGLNFLGPGAPFLTPLQTRPELRKEFLKSG